MEIKPVKNYKTPAYPTIERYVYNPQEFLRHTPHSWLGNAAVMTALLAFSVGGSNCVYGQIIKPNTEQTDKKTNKNNKSQQEHHQTSHVAPIFVHGDGTGAFGCIVIAPPVILSEEDALQIIKAELAKHNLILDSTNQSIQIPVNQIKWIDDTTAAQRFNVIKEKNLKFDGEIKNINFLVEYLSSRDYYSFKDDNFTINKKGKIFVSWSSVSGIDTKQMATLIREKILKENKHNAVVFYDPMARLDKSKLDENIKGFDNMTEQEQEEFFEKSLEELNENYSQQAQPISMGSRELLIQQVTDFIEWLKKEKLLTE